MVRCIPYFNFFSLSLIDEQINPSRIYSLFIYSYFYLSFYPPSCEVQHNVLLWSLPYIWHYYWYFFVIYAHTSIIFECQIYSIWCQTLGMESILQVIQDVTNSIHSPLLSLHSLFLFEGSCFVLHWALRLQDIKHHRQSRFSLFWIYSSF